MESESCGFGIVVYDREAMARHEAEETRGGYGWSLPHEAGKGIIVNTDIINLGLRLNLGFNHDGLLAHNLDIGFSFFTLFFIYR